VPPAASFQFLMQMEIPMKPMNDKPTLPPAPELPKTPPKLKRFRLVRLEERIAPSAGGNGHEFTHKCRPSW
jgi:hypothetical protein